MLTVVLVVALVVVAAIAVAGWLLRRAPRQTLHRGRGPSVGRAAVTPHDPIRQDHVPP